MIDSSTPPPSDFINQLRTTLSDKLRGEERLEAVASSIQEAFMQYTDAAHASIALCTMQPTTVDSERATTPELIRSRLIGQYETVNPQLLRPISDDPTARDVFDKKTPQIYPNLDHSKPPDWDKTSYQETRNIKSWIGLPLFSFDQPVGFITLDHDKSGKFDRFQSAHDSNVLAYCAELSANAIHNCLLARNLRVLKELMEGIGVQYNIISVLCMAAEKLRDSLNCRQCIIFEHLEDQQRSFVRSWVSETGPCYPATSFNESEGIAGWVLRSGTSRSIPNIEDKQRAKDFKEAPKSRPFHSMLAVPMAVDKAISGVICVDDNNPFKFSKYDLQLVELVASQIATLVELIKHRQSQFQNVIDTNRILMTTQPESFHVVTREQLKIACKAIGAMDAVLLSVERQSKKEVGDKKNNSTVDVNHKIAITSCDEAEVEFRLDDLDDLSNKVFKKRIPERIDNIDPEKCSNINHPLKKRGGIQSAICLPLDIGSKVLGVIWFYYKDNVAKRLEEDKQVLNMHANMFGLAIDNYLRRIKSGELEEAIAGLDNQFLKDYGSVRKQQWWQFLVSLVFGTLGASVIIMSLFVIPLDELERTIGAIAGAVAMVISTLLFQSADKINDRADRYHKEQLHFRQLDYVVKIANSLSDQEARLRLQEECVRTAVGNWFVSSAATSDKHSKTSSDNADKPR